MGPGIPLSDRLVQDVIAIATLQGLFLLFFSGRVDPFADDTNAAPKDYCIGSRAHCGQLFYLPLPGPKARQFPFDRFDVLRIGATAAP